MSSISFLEDVTARFPTCGVTGELAALFFRSSNCFPGSRIVATVLGSVIAQFPEKWIRRGAGLLFLAFSFQMWRDRNDMDGSAFSQRQSCENRSFWSSFWRAFIVIFIAEWLDLTQIATASLIAKSSDFNFNVFLAALLALWSVTAVVITIGQKSKKYLKPILVKSICACIFLCIGIYFVETAVKL